MESKKPILERLSQWGEATEVIYRCPNCETSFHYYGIKEKFCHECGTPINWNVVVKVPKSLANIYHKSGFNRKKQLEVLEFIKEINKKDLKFPTELQAILEPKIKEFEIKEFQD